VTAALALGSLAGCAPPSGDRATVQMLWFGTAADGTPTYGVTPVEVDARRGPNAEPFAVDMSAAGDAGDQWQTAAWTAATVGSMLAGADPRGLTISYRLGQSIDGPSAGAVLTTAVLADLRESAELSTAVTMTGTVLPSGAIGPVGGIPAKLKAAAENGIETVLIPRGQDIVNDPVTGRRAAVSDLAAELGISVVAVDSVQQPFGYFTSPDDPAAAAADPTPSGSATPDAETGATLPSELAELFADATRATLPRLAGITVATSPASALDADRQRVAAGVAAARSRTAELLDAGRVIDAYARVTLAERESLAWNARVQTFVAATADGPGTARSLADEAARLAQAADAATATADRTVSLAFVEQAAALPDVLSWATDSWAVATMAATALSAEAAASPADLATLAAVLTSARYDLDVYLPFSAEVAARVGRVPLSDPRETADILAAYAQVLADTGAAVANDASRETTEATASTAQLLGDPLAWEYRALVTLGERWAELEQATVDAASPADVAPALSTAMSYYVAATTWAATSQLARVAGSSREFSPSAWTTQVDVATAESLRSAVLSEKSGLDPDYLAWNEGFGRSVATAAEAIGANDAIRLNGLQVQWYGNVQGHTLLALGLETG
jgi:hypothetical protein